MFAPLPGGSVRPMNSVEVDRVRTLQPSIFGLLLIAIPLGDLFFWRWFVDSRILTQVYAATNGLVGATWCFTLGELLLVGAFLIVVGRLRPPDLGWRPTDVPVALGALLSLWITEQVGLLTLDMILQRAPVLGRAWKHDHGISLVGLTLGQVFGSALYEEVVFRAVLFRQLGEVLGRRTGSGRTATLLAIILSNSYFMLNHLPYVLRGHGGALEVAGSLAFIATCGVAYTLLYIRTGNVLLVSVVHGLCNMPLPLLRPVVEPAVILAGLVLIAYLAWPRLVRAQPRSSELVPS